MRLALLLLAFASTLCLAEPRPKPDRGHVPANGLVPDATTAIAIAVAVWTPIYGAETIKSQRPYKAKLVQGVRHVEGSLDHVPGGVAEARIAKQDGRVLYMMHSK